jgi:hypothetical protein
LRDFNISEQQREGMERGQFGTEGAGAATATNLRQSILNAQGGVLAPMVAGMGVSGAVESVGAAAGFSPEATASTSAAAAQLLAGPGAQLFDQLIGTLRASNRTQEALLAAQERATKATEDLTSAQRRQGQTAPPTRPVTDAARNQINQGGG